MGRIFFLCLCLVNAQTKTTAEKSRKLSYRKIENILENARQKDKKEKQIMIKYFNKKIKNLKKTINFIRAGTVLTEENIENYIGENGSLIGKNGTTIGQSGVLIGEGDAWLIGDGATDTKGLLIGQAGGALIGSGTAVGKEKLIGAGNGSGTGASQQENPKLIRAGNAALIGSGDTELIGSGNTAKLIGSANNATLIGSKNTAKLIGSGNVAKLIGPNSSAVVINQNSTNGSTAYLH